jgi:hypothetical protein
MSFKRSWKRAPYVLLAALLRAEHTQGQGVLSNPIAYIPSQCYTKTLDASGNVHNPCYACHTRGTAPNFIHDANLQQVYDFPEEARRNPWNNLFKDRRAERGVLSDAQTLDYVRTSNYRSTTGALLMSQRLQDPKQDWDRNGNGSWDGYVPDAFFHFDPQGFDHGPEGKLSWWRAFSYYPFLGTFWPANGSTDDVLIRLPPPFHHDAKGRDDLAIYRLNLAILEALIRAQDVPLMQAVDEQPLSHDLDQDGHVGQARYVRYTGHAGAGMHFVGEAGSLQDKGLIHAAAGLYPEGTELLHSVRYLDVDQQGRVVMAARMKELRYARKSRYLNYAALQDLASHDDSEQLGYPDRLEMFYGDAERGGQNGRGWIYQGFIEDAQGELRPQDWEETVSCLGCHGGIGVTTDSSFAFPRKIKLGEAGWGHGMDFAGLPEPMGSDGRYEYTAYLKQNHAGDEFRENQELIGRFFDTQGLWREDAGQRLHMDSGYALSPSAARALELDKAYWLIVRDQGFHQGRDALLAPATEVHRELEYRQATGVDQPLANPDILPLP